MDSREARVALNESRFRDINDRIVADLESLATRDDMLDFVCECARLTCRDMVRLTLAEYQHTRSDPRHFAVRPGHEAPDVERVIGGVAGRYFLIEKLPPTWPLVEATDPRS